MVTKVMGYDIDIKPNKVFIYDADDSIDGVDIPNKIVHYLISEGFCDNWISEEEPIKVNIYKRDD